MHRDFAEWYSAGGRIASRLPVCATAAVPKCAPPGFDRLLPLDSVQQFGEVEAGFGQLARRAWRLFGCVIRRECDDYFLRLAFVVEFRRAKRDPIIDATGFGDGIFGPAGGPIVVIA